tara:strand:+ start:902 stop:1798 length:897 start_codon:yes stop_codon:yes gene_type:complete
MAINNEQMLSLGFNKKESSMPTIDMTNLKAQDEFINDAISSMYLANKIANPRVKGLNENESVFNQMPSSSDYFNKTTSQILDDPIDKAINQIAQVSPDLSRPVASNEEMISYKQRLIERIDKERQKQGKQEGGEVLQQAINTEETDTQLDMAGLGPLGLVDDMDGERQTGVADDLPMDLPEGSYVLNAHAVELIGVKDLNQIIKDAITIAVEAGYDLPKKVDPTKKVPIQISNGEFVIPEILVPIIGLENLEKMNRRGLEYRKQQEAEAGEKQQVANVQEAPVDAETQDLMDQIKDVA